MKYEIKYLFLSTESNLAGKIQIVLEVPVIPLNNIRGCSGFGWDRLNFLPSTCCVLDLVGE